MARRVNEIFGSRAGSIATSASFAVLVLFSAAQVSASAAGAPSPASAVAALVGPQTSCWLKQYAGSRWAQCPVTARLHKQLYGTGQGLFWSALCPCPGLFPGRRTTIGRPAIGGRTAVVAVLWIRGPISYRTTFVVVLQTDGWRVDTDYCRGLAPWSIYSNAQHRGCGATIAPSFRPRGASSPVRAVRTVIGTSSMAGPTCHDPLTCPYTRRLLRYMLDGSAESNLVRSENPAYAVQIRQTHSHGQTAAVNVGWSWSDGGTRVAWTTTFVVVHTRTGWLVDDQYCAGRPQTTIYGPRAGSCR